MFRYFLAVLAVLPLILSCGSGTSSNPFSIAAPAISVSSPTAATSSHRFRLFSRADVVDKPADMKPPGEMMEGAKTDFGLSPTDIIAKMGTIEEVKEYRSPCFGPPWTDNATGSTSVRPPGDLGIVYATRDDLSTEACAAAQLTSLVGGKPHLFNKVRMLVTAMMSKAKDEGKSLPAVETEIDITPPPVTDITFTTVKLKRLADDADGNAVYKTTIEATKGGKPLKVTLYHTPLNADNTESKGLFQAVLPHTASMGGSGNARGMSLVYLEKDGVLTYVMDSVANRTVQSNDFFDTTTGRVVYTGAQAGEDFNKMIAKLTKATGAATVHFAWQAGAADPASRAFAVTTTGNTSGSTATAYFGFANSFGTLSDSTSTMWPKEMRCNWLGSPGTAISFVQMQTMTYGTKEFAPTANAFAFAPSNTCINASWSVSAGPPFLVGAKATAAHSLVAPGTEIPPVTAPTFTKP